MKRRDFVVRSSIAAGAFASLPMSCNITDGSASTELKNWIWVGPEPERSVDDWKRIFDNYMENGISATLLEVFHGNNAHYQSEVLETSDNMLERSLVAAGTTGMEVHAWMWTMPCMVPSVLENHPEWYNVNALGQSSSTHPAYVGYYKFLCPRRPETREFITQRVRELTTFDGLKGVHLDYVRHPDAILPVALWDQYNLVQDKVYPEFDYCYCEYCRNEFRSLHGIDPMELEDPTSNMEWMQFRWDSVTDLVNDHLVPAARKGDKQITAAVFPGPSLAKANVRQNWGEWNLDGFLPMIYHSFYEEDTEWIGRMVKEGVETVGAERMYCGLFVPGMKDSSEFEEALRVSVENEANGVCLFGMKDQLWDNFKKTIST